MELQGTPNSQTVMKKNKAGKLILLDCRTTYKATVIKTAVYKTMSHGTLKKN